MVVGEFLFLVTKSLKSRSLDLLSNHEISFQNFFFHLEIRDMDSIFRFLFSISLFGISSMPGTNARISKKFIRRHLLIKFACYKVPPVMVPTHGSVVPLAMFFPVLFVCHIIILIFTFICIAWQCLNVLCLNI